MDTNTALAIATEAHRGQADKSGVDYIHHPMRIASNFAHDSDESVVALLHDVLEDTNWTLDDLFDEGLSQVQADALVAITHLNNEPNVDYIARVKRNSLATRVKLADLDDNSSPERMRNLDEATQERLQAKYDRAYAQLLA